MQWHDVWIVRIEALANAFFLCLALRRTGNLWFGIGVDTAVGWGTDFLFSVPRHGIHAYGHLLDGSMRGWSLLSIFTTFLIVATSFLLATVYPDVKYPALDSPTAVGQPGLDPEGKRSLKMIRWCCLLLAVLLILIAPSFIKNELQNGHQRIIGTHIAIICLLLISWWALRPPNRSKSQGSQPSEKPSHVLNSPEDGKIALWCYLVPIAAVFFLVEKPYKNNPFLRFHAFQSIMLAVVTIILRLLAIFRLVRLNDWIGGLTDSLTLAVFITWIVLMATAYKGKALRVPVIGSIAGYLADRGSTEASLP